MEVLVEFNYTAQNEDELTIKYGDKIKNVTRKEDGWLEGELASGAKGLFPENFVKVSHQPNNIKQILSFNFLSRFSKINRLLLRREKVSSQI